VPVGRTELVRALQRRVINPLTRALIVRGLLPTHVLIETTGRRSGLPRSTPVGNGLRGDTLWVVAEHGRRADYVRNIETNPRVRVKAGRGPWRLGTAHLLADDDPAARLRSIGRPVNAAAVRLFGTDLLTVRVDLDPPREAEDRR
jgi:deazaflavin-dependent oxidoreductase (nitroreductase family)